MGKPPLDGVDRQVERFGQPALVAAGLGGMDGRHQRRAGHLSERHPALRDQPVVGVHDVRTPAPHHRQRSTHEGVLGCQRPGKQALGREVDGDRVDGRTPHPHAVAHLVDGCACRGAWTDARRAAWAGLGLTAGDDADVVPGLGERARQCVDVASQPAHDERWVLPRQHQDAHGDRH